MMTFPNARVHELHAEPSFNSPHRNGVHRKRGICPPVDSRYCEPRCHQDVEVKDDAAGLGTEYYDGLRNGAPSGWSQCREFMATRRWRIRRTTVKWSIEEAYLSSWSSDGSSSSGGCQQKRRCMYLPQKREIESKRVNIIFSNRLCM